MTKSPDRIRTYADWRKVKWEKQEGYKHFNFRRSEMKNGDTQVENYLQPKENFHFKDIIHCATQENARGIIRRLSHMKDVEYLEMRGTWVWVNFNHKGDFLLPGQGKDGRETVTG